MNTSDINCNLLTNTADFLCKTAYIQNNVNDKRKAPDQTAKCSENILFCSQGKQNLDDMFFLSAR